MKKRYICGDGGGKAGKKMTQSQPNEGENGESTDGTKRGSSADRIFDVDDVLGRHLGISIRAFKQELDEHEMILDNAQNLPQENRVRNSIERARRLLQAAKSALEDGDLLFSLRYFYKATEEKVTIFKYIDENTDDSSERFRPFVLKLPQMASKYFSSEEVSDLKSTILTDDGEVREDISEQTIRSTYRNVYGEVVHELEAVLTIKTLLTTLIVILFSLLIGFFVVILGGPVFSNNLKCILQMSGQAPCPSNPRYPNILHQNEFFLLVSLMGFFGSVVSNVRTWSGEVFDISSDFGSPQLSIASRLVVARILVGAVAAMFIYSILMSGILSTRFTTPGFILAVSFVSGFSDQVLVAGVNEILKGVGEKQQEDNNSPL